MFEQATLSSANAARRAWTTGLGFAGEAVFVAFIAIAPMIWPEALPKPQALLILLTPPAPLPPATDVVVKPHATHAPITPIRFILPASIPTSIAQIVDDPPEVIGGVPGPGRVAGDRDGLMEGILNAPAATPAQPATVKPPGPKPNADAGAPRRIRTSSIELARLIHRVEPIYPYVARIAHVSGAVELSGIIAIDGRIRELKVLSGNPLLVKAAVDAVSQWIYAPPVLNGERVEVIAPITVNFRLDR
jgi:protein TonB